MLLHHIFRYSFRFLNLLFKRLDHFFLFFIQVNEEHERQLNLCIFRVTESINQLPELTMMCEDPPQVKFQSLNVDFLLRNLLDLFICSLNSLSNSDAQSICLLFELFKRLLNLLKILILRLKLLFYSECG